MTQNRLSGIPTSDGPRYSRVHALAHLVGALTHFIRRRHEADASHQDRRKVQGALVGKIDMADLLTEQDFQEGKHARIDAVARKYDPSA